MGRNIEIQEETRKCADIIYENWAKEVDRNLNRLESDIDGHVSGRIANPEWLDIYFTPLITENWGKISVKESIQVLMKFYLEGDSPIWSSWTDYSNEYREGRSWGSLRKEKIHTQFIPDPLMNKMIAQIEAETSYSKNDFKQFSDLFSLEKNYPIDRDDKNLERVFSEVLIHEISHWVLYKLCDQKGHSYPSHIGEAIGWFLDHEIYQDNTYHIDGRNGAEDLSVGIFSDYSFSKSEQKYVVWLINALKSSYKMQSSQQDERHPYTWSNKIILHITNNNEITKQHVFMALVPRKLKTAVKELERMIEEEYNKSYHELLEMTDVKEEDIDELNQSALENPDNKKLFLEKKRFYEAIKSLRLELESDVELEDPVNFENFIEQEFDSSEYHKRSFGETLRQIQGEIQSRSETQVEQMNKAIEICISADQEMSDQGIGELNGEILDERKEFREKFKDLKNLESRMEDHLDKIEHQLFLHKLTKD